MSSPVSSKQGALPVTLVAESVKGIEEKALEGRRAFVRFRKDGEVPQITVLRSAAVDGMAVSVIVPSLNGMKSGLPALLRQLQDQSFPAFEVIVVSGDRRQGRAINIAAAIARGRILITLDDDTRLGSPDLLDRIVEAFAVDPTIGIAGVANLIPDDAPWLVRRAMHEIPRRSIPLVHEIVDTDLVEHGCLAIRRDVLIRVGGEHEWLPRGLDPYLRREVRRIGYRVVAIPGAWVHHLPPSSYRKLLRLFFRNGATAAYVKKFLPEFVIDQAIRHGAQTLSPSSGSRALRYVGRTAQALFRGRWIYLSTLAAYAVGYTWGLLTMREESL